MANSHTGPFLRTEQASLWNVLMHGNGDDVWWYALRPACAVARRGAGCRGERGRHFGPASGGLTGPPSYRPERAPKDLRRPAGVLTIEASALVVHALDHEHPPVASKRLPESFQHFDGPSVRCFVATDDYAPRPWPVRGHLGA